MTSQFKSKKSMHKLSTLCCLQWKNRIMYGLACNGSSWWTCTCSCGLGMWNSTSTSDFFDIGLAMWNSTSTSDCGLGMWNTTRLGSSSIWIMSQMVSTSSARKLRDVKFDQPIWLSLTSNSTNTSIILTSIPSDWVQNSIKFLLNQMQNSRV